MFVIKEVVGLVVMWNSDDAQQVRWIKDGDVFCILLAEYYILISVDIIADCCCCCLVSVGYFPKSVLTYFLKISQRRLRHVSFCT